jgi:glutamate 5-kinase
MARPSLNNFRRIVVKVGSSLLVDSDAGEVRASWLSALADDVAKLHKAGREVLIVSSGSIALGRSRLKLPRGPLKLEEARAAAVDQMALAASVGSAWTSRHRRRADLVTLQDTEERRRYLHARSTIGRCWNGARCLSSTRTTRLPPTKSATATMTPRRPRCTMASADLLILLSDIDGLL